MSDWVIRNGEARKAHALRMAVHAMETAYPTYTVELQSHKWIHGGHAQGFYCEACHAALDKGNQRFRTCKPKQKS